MSRATLSPLPPLLPLHGATPAPFTHTIQAPQRPPWAHSIHWTLGTLSGSSVPRGSGQSRDTPIMCPGLCIRPLDPQLSESFRGSQACPAAWNHPGTHRVGVGAPHPLTQRPGVRCPLLPPSGRQQSPGVQAPTCPWAAPIPFDGQPCLDRPQAEPTTAHHAAKAWSSDCFSPGSSPWRRAGGRDWCWLLPWWAGPTGNWALWGRQRCTQSYLPGRDERSAWQYGAPSHTVSPAPHQTGPPDGMQTLTGVELRFTTNNGLV